MTKKRTIKVALAGNPNAGKTCIFNALTGAHQHVGNYPGVTVELARGVAKVGDYTLDIVDLPGTYSLTAYSDDEREARKVILEEKLDVIVNIVDTSNLDRNLYLTVQLIELGANVVIAMNMSDEARAQGIMPNLDLLSGILGVPLVETVGNRSRGIDELIQTIIRSAEKPPEHMPVSFHRDVETEIEKILPLLEKIPDTDIPFRYAAVKLIENDSDIIDRIKEKTGSACLEVLEQLKTSRTHLERLLGELPEVFIAELRHGIASGAAAESVMQVKTRAATRQITHRIDNILLNRILGLPIFAVAMYFVFWLTFAVGSPMMSWVEVLFEWLATSITTILPEGILQSLVVDGIIGGVGGVLVFVPNIMLLFFAISILEDTGYMARAAFIMDKLMHKIGLHGRSFIPMLIGFGCTVPAVMATRVLDNKRDRFTTIMVLPLMSCGARLPVYLLIISAFFPAYRANVLWLIYIAGILLAILIAKLLRVSILKGENAPFVMELPPYRIPTITSLIIHVWQKIRHYLIKAGTVILAFSVIIWFLTSFPKTENYQVDRLLEEGLLVETETSFDLPYITAAELEQKSLSIDETSAITQEEIQNARSAEEIAGSVMGRFGRIIEPVLKPLDFDWRIGTALIGALGAKEIFVSQMGILYSMGEAGEESDNLSTTLRDRYSPITGIAIMLFILIMAPCIPALVVVRKETGSWIWALGQFFGLTLLAYIIVLIYSLIAGLVI